MKSADVLLYLQRNNMTVFTTNDLSRILGKPIGYARSVVRGIPGVRKAERGLYYTEQANVYEIASNIVPFSYVSMLSALRYYDITTQIPLTVSVVSPKRHRQMQVDGRKIRFVKFKKSIIFGHVRRGNAFIAEPEKALLDSLYYGDYAYLDEAFESGIDNGLVSADRLTDYAYRFGKRSLINKLGFFLDHYCGIEKTELLSHRSVKAVRLSTTANVYDKKWRVLYGE